MINVEPTTHEIAFTAGLFEGEGTVVYVQSHNSLYVRVKMTDDDVVEKMFEMLGGRLSKPLKPGKPHHKPQFEWILGDRESVIRLYSLWKPWLGKRRRAQFEEKIALSEPRRRPAALHCVTDPTVPTQRGYHAHLRMGTEPCEPCRQAYNLYMEQYRRSKGTPERSTAMTEEERVQRRRELRRSRYATDLEYRKKVLERNAQNRERRNHDLS